MATRRWSDLSERNRRLIVVTGAAEAVLKIAALVDLRRRPAEEVRGSKKLWAVAIVLVNSVGAVPIAYFALGRRRTTPR
ncbi:MAG: PLD nuclease N-terminal domain-containing protein [Angustibacter sp.]